ncbi:DUF1801 domain-containing protein [Demequina muriae]|uniref:DUF1801 domain-containing protein n=1 Tax=Demequina muriae TaxID=3051664 RepID=A0ABT8GK53_9MICO|nr:DUF1801 domain-containing protein [Demequina sp. EGI L300058]MDN4481815.1 DUF1801 domain-containing protein [Demequina sp. EGI L300058]
MADNATQPTDQDVEEFLASVEPARRREDGFRLLALMAEVTGEAPTMWGPSIVGFGQRHYTYASGREGDWMRVGYSPRKTQLSLYGLKDHPLADDVLERLGPHSTGAGCVYIKQLDAVNEGVLRELIDLAYRSADDAS